MFLDTDEEDRVRVKKGGMKIPSLIDLYNTDKRPGKTFFEKCITLMYHKNKRIHQFSNLGPKERLEKVKSVYFPDYDISKILENPKYIAAEEDYITLELTSTQRLYEGIKKSIEYWNTYMSKIPMTKEVMYNGMHDVTIDTDNGPKVVQMAIKTKIHIDNSEEYLKAMKNAEEMLEREEKIRKKVIYEEQKARVIGEDSMLQSGDFNHLLKIKKGILS